MTDDKFYTSLSANNIMAKLTNHVQRTRLITPSTDKHYSLDSEDDFRSGCRNVSHQQQFFSELLSPGRSHNTNYQEKSCQHHQGAIVPVENCRQLLRQDFRLPSCLLSNPFVTLLQRWDVLLNPPFPKAVS